MTSAHCTFTCLHRGVNESDSFVVLLDVSGRVDTTAPIRGACDVPHARRSVSVHGTCTPHLFARQTHLSPFSLCKGRLRIFCVHTDFDVLRHQLPEEVTRYYLRQGGVECQDDTTCVPCHRSFRADQAESENAPIKPIKRTHDIECPLDDDRRLLPAPLRRPPRPARAA